MFQPGVEVRHLDGNPSNARPSNVALGTHKENMMDRSPDARTKTAIAASSARRRFTDVEVSSIRSDRSDGLTYRQLGEKYSVSKSTLSYLLNKAYY